MSVAPELIALRAALFCSLRRAHARFFRANALRWAKPSGSRRSQGVLIARWVAQHAGLQLQVSRWQAAHLVPPRPKATD
jgi:hypothetical protein